MHVVRNVHLTIYLIYVCMYVCMYVCTSNAASYNNTCYTPAMVSLTNDRFYQANKNVVL
jgi:hypothetical protein